MSTKKNKDLEDRPDVFVTSKGVPIYLKEVNPLLVQRIRDSVEYPEIPTYEAELPGGAKEVHRHNETTEKTPEEEEAWLRYKIESAAAQGEAGNRVAEAMFEEGIDWSRVRVPADSKWAPRLERYGITIPEDKAERKRLYVEVVLLSSGADLTGLLAKIMRLTPGVAKEAVDAAEASFQRAVEGQASE